MPMFRKIINTQSMLVGILMVTSLACTAEPNNHRLPPEEAIADGLKFEENPVLLGVIKSGKSVAKLVNIENPFGGSIDLEIIETSCPCIKIQGTPIRFNTGERKEITIEYDSSHEPEFRGELRVMLKGKSPTGKLVLIGTVDIEVKANIP